MNDNHIHPIDDHVFARPLKQGERKSAGGIVIPEASPSKRDVEVVRAIVVAVGPGRMTDSHRVPAVVRVDHEIVFAKARAIEIELDGQKLWVVKEGDIFSILNRPAAAEDAKGDRPVLWVGEVIPFLEAAHHRTSERYTVVATGLMKPDGSLPPKTGWVRFVSYVRRDKPSETFTKPEDDFRRSFYRL